MMNYQNKSKDELIKELHQLKQENLRLRDANYLTFLESMQDMIVVGTPEGRVLYANNAFKKKLGYSLEELDALGILGVHPEDRREEAEEIFAAMFRGERDSCPLPVQRRDGALIPVDTRVSFGKWDGMDCIFGVIKDLSAEQEAKQRFERLFRHNPALMALSSMQERRFVDVNDAFLRKLGYEQAEVLGKTSSELGLFKNVKKQKEVSDRLAAAGRLIDYEMKVRCKNGTFLDGLFSGDVVISQDKQYFLTVMIDITERKSAEKKLVALNQDFQIAKEKAEESDQLKTAFLQNMSHEIRTPLNAINGFSELLGESDLTLEKRKSFVQIIQNSSSQLISIVTDILTISAIETRQERVAVNNVCINTLIIQLLAIFKQQTINRNISLYAKQPLNDKNSEIYTDKTKITQILSNLLSNAIKFTHEGFIEFGYSLKDNYLEFYVKDTGIGIKPEFHEKIFDRFRQAYASANKMYGGTGLGLSISKGFTEMLGGRIWVESEIDKGSTFYFTVPYNPVNKANGVITQNQSDSYKRTFIVAEDEELNYAYIEILLKRYNLNIIHTKDGKETIDIFKKNPEIDLILMDIKMPLMHGDEAARIIKTLKPGVPIIAQSAYALETERAKYHSLFDDYLLKPFTAIDLKQILMKFVNVDEKE